MEIIIINDSENIVVPSKTKMSIVEIAELFGIFYQTAKRQIRTIEKSGIAEGDYSMTCKTESNKVYPVYYGLEMVIAVAFRVQSPKANAFRKWLTHRTTEANLPWTIMLSTQNSMLN